jgi:hypothetical protein
LAQTPDILHDLEQIDDLKNHLIDRFILLGAILGLSIFILSLYPWDDSYLNADLFIDISIQLFLFGLYFYRKSFSLTSKANVILTLVFIAYISDLIENNINGTGISLLILIPFCAIFVYNFRVTLTIFLTAVGIYFGIAFLFINGYIENANYDADTILLATWVNQVATDILIAVIIFIFVLRYNKSVDNMILKLEKAVSILADRDDQLEKSLAEKM